MKSCSVPSLCSSLLTLVNRKVLLGLQLFTIALILPTLVCAADPEPPIRFGANLSLTGGSAVFGQACQNGITLAVEDINRDGGIRHSQLEVLVQDFGDVDIKRAVSAARQFIDVRHVVALLPNWSEDAEVLGPIAKSAGIISMTLGAGGPGAARYSPTLFRSTTSDGELAKKSVQEMRGRNAKNACIFLADTNYYVDIGKVLRSAWLDSGGAITSDQTFRYEDTDLRSNVTKLRNASCDAIFIWASPSTVSALVRELNIQNIAGQRILPWYGDSADIVQSTKGDKHSFFIYRYVLSDAQFIEKYRTRFGGAPLRPAGNCYDGVRVLAQAMNTAGTEMNKVKDALLALTGYQGVTGPFVIGDDRERSGEKIERVTLEDGIVR